jgi:hypothetical protein
MQGNFDLFIAHEIRQIGGYMPDVDALRNASTRVVSAAGEGSDPQQFAERLHEVPQARRFERYEDPGLTNRRKGP